MKCLVGKTKAWGDLRKCQRAEEAKRLRGKPSDPMQCQTKLQKKLEKLDEKAIDRAIACRYGDNGDQTVTDYDTGSCGRRRTGSSGACVSSHPVSIIA